MNARIRLSVCAEGSRECCRKDDTEYMVEIIDVYIRKWYHVIALASWFLWKIGYVIRQGNGRAQIGLYMIFNNSYYQKRRIKQRSNIHDFNMTHANYRCKMPCPKVCDHHRIDAFVNAL